MTMSLFHPLHTGSGSHISGKQEISDMRLSDSEVVPFQQKMPYFSSNGIEIEGI